MFGLVKKKKLDEAIETCHCLEKMLAECKAKQLTPIDEADVDNAIGTCATCDGWKEGKCAKIGSPVRQRKTEQNFYCGCWEKKEQ